ncbi:MAG: hypothetical protein HLUCCA08_16170 [Rhodobacteraceae bacterium HLUCCA08]|nr:MAG: hypothetical protein HLUCCA08_16170 [Rhodobacteraceae bacterium HLUCCA08]
MKRLFAGGLAAALLTLASTASAALLSFTDRGAFEAALSNITVDDMNTGLPQSGQSSITRPDFVLTGATFGCQTSGCGYNSSKGFTYPGYVWFYTGGQTFGFNGPVYGFGFDYAVPIGYTPATFTLQGLTAPTGDGFFGVVSDVPLTQISMSISGGDRYMIGDNFTYGRGPAIQGPAPVPLPPALPALAAGLGLLALTARRTSRV